MQISKDQPLAEITLRKYGRPSTEINNLMEERLIVKKLCLSLGLLQLGDSRDIIVDILMVLLNAKSDKRKLTLEEIKKYCGEYRQELNIEKKGLTDSNIRRQLKRLQDIHLINKENNSLYYINEFENLSHLFNEKIKSFLVDSTIKRIEEYLSVIDSLNFKLEDGKEN